MSTQTSLPGLLLPLAMTALQNSSDQQLAGGRGFSCLETSMRECLMSYFGMITGHGLDTYTVPGPKSATVDMTFETSGYSLLFLITSFPAVVDDSIHSLVSSPLIPLFRTLGTTQFAVPQTTCSGLLPAIFFSTPVLALLCGAFHRDKV